MKKALLLPLLCASSALAADVGEIALVRDPGNITMAAIIGAAYAERSACAFYEEHGDTYDALFVFSSIPLNALTRTQQGWATRSAAQGIGRNVYPTNQARFCGRRIRHVVKMGDIASFSDDPDAVYAGAPGFTLSGVELMGHEFGHQWMAGMTWLDGIGQRHCFIRGLIPPNDPPTTADCDGYRNSDFGQHWSYYFNTGSVMYGNTIADLGGGQFAFTQGRVGYSELDQYMMGLRDPSEVSPMFVVRPASSQTPEPTSFPVERGQTVMIEGERVDLTIGDIIRAEGPRDPPRDICHWKAAFVILFDDAHMPTAQQIARVDAYRRRWETFYADATSRRGSFDTTLAGTGNGTAECTPSGMVLPVPDAGVFAPDAAQPDASDDATADDDAAVAVAPDATAIAVVPDARAIPDTGPRTLLVDDCACATASRAGMPTSFAVLFVLALVGRRRRLIF